MKAFALCLTLSVVGFCRAFQHFLPVALPLVLLLVLPFCLFYLGASYTDVLLSLGRLTGTVRYVAV